ncbi:MAG: signal peptidase I [Lachnospiraceae bacterium]|nr:signal peptidase I [Lachnospiraceae bacterium]
MYDEDLIEESLEACRNLEIVREGTTASGLFDRLHELNAASSSRSWENVLDEIDTSSIKQEITQTAFIPAVEKQNNIIGIKSNGSKSKKLLHNFLLAVICIAAAFFLSMFINSNIAHQTTIEGGSMEPALKNNDSVIIQKLSYYWQDPGRYDIIVFPITDRDEDGKKIYYIKRIIGLPGEIVQIIDGSVYINGKRLDDDIYSDEKIEDPGIAESPVQLAEDEYFVLGDNRNMSTDSRYTYVGMVKREDIEGEACCCIWPFSRIKKI